MPAEHCGMCGEKKIQPHDGALAICRQCDRLKCGHCRNGDLSGVAKTCLSCGEPLRGLVR